ncbi:hypothetical protein Back2_11510 [Nocardioides baekrokdamisoli]|uniref:Steroid 5-alpha reductase C-terminal domain-containing protein n=1 Tax=Nocardioides baekrokdamisoli TaxID=1804624 RepID=A0A3G9J080_9ACTN|nr:DUF1295 domain-containing protein [Nocardioides baekrokdamisoli]BBH16864.1 hypothetical protein Back2_11510 [Nocardioides baekrokdamisoli]
MVSTVWWAEIAAVTAAMTGTAIVAFLLRRIAIVDAGWGVAFVAAAITVTVASPSWSARSWLLLAMVVAWGGRLSWHLGRRTLSSRHDDPRYVEMLGGAIGEVPASRVVLKVFVLQAVIVAIIATPVTYGISHPMGSWWVVGIGVVAWLAGVHFESVGDAQLAAHRANLDRGPILDTGLWAWTRHPNYFGDACVWWGIWLVGAASSGWRPALATVIAPAAMTFFLVSVSGVRLTEQRMAGRPGWDAYAASTPAFIPRPPRRTRRH